MFLKNSNKKKPNTNIYNYQTLYIRGHFIIRKRSSAVVSHILYSLKNPIEEKDRRVKYKEADLRYGLKWQIYKLFFLEKIPF